MDSAPQADWFFGFTPPNVYPRTQKSTRAPVQVQTAKLAVSLHLDSQSQIALFSFFFLHILLLLDNFQIFQLPHQSGLACLFALHPLSLCLLPWPFFSLSSITR